MQVRITNVTDGPGQKPREVRVHTQRLRPGNYMDVPIQFIDEKVRKLEQTGAIIIGKLPPWYDDHEARRKVRNLTSEEVTANLKVKKKAKEDAAKTTPVVLAVADTVTPPTDTLEVAAPPSTMEARPKTKR